MSAVFNGLRKPSQRLGPARQGQRGNTLVSVVIVLGVISVLSMGWAQRQLSAATSDAGAAAGYALNQVAQAVDNYRAANMSTLTTATPAVAGFDNPNAPTIPELIAANYLNSAMTSALPDGNAYKISIQKEPPGCIGPLATCQVYSVLSLSNPIVDTSTGLPSITYLGALAKAIQDPVGFSSAPDTSNITGGAGTWTVANPDPAKRAGIVVVVSGLGGTDTQYLRSAAEPRDPNFASSVSVSGYTKPSAGPGQTVVAGTACTDPQGAIRNDAAGRVLSCQSGIWTAADGSKSIAQGAPISNVPGGSNFPVGVCPAGGTPWASYTAQSPGVNDTVTPPVEALFYSVSQVGSNWVTLTQGAQPGGSMITINGNATVLGYVPTGVFSSGCSFS